MLCRKYYKLGIIMFDKKYRLKLAQYFAQNPIVFNF